MSNDQRQYWIGVACKEHVANGVNLGICQVCHGKQAPLKRIKNGDYFIYYSPKIRMNEPGLYQKFTAIGEVVDDEPYQVDMSGGFKPFRRNIRYFKAKHADIRPLIEDLSFIKNKKSWGFVFRYGLIKIDEASYHIIAEQMLDDVSKGEYTL